MQKKAKINKKITLFVFLVAIVIFSTVLVSDGPKKILSSLKSANPSYLILASIIFLTAWVFEGIIIYLLITKIIKKDYQIKDAIYLTVIGRLFDCLTPMSTGGQPFQAWKMHKQGIPVNKSSSILIFKFIIWQFSVILMYSVIIVLNFDAILLSQSSFKIFIIIGYLVNTLLALLLVSSIFLPKILKKQIYNIFNFLENLNIMNNTKSKKQKISNEIDEFYISFKKISKNKFLVLRIFLLTAIQIFLLHSTTYFVFLSLGAKNNLFFNSFSASNYVALISSFIPLPGASIGAEGSFVLFFSPVYPKNAIALAMVIWRFITYYLPILIGFLFVIDYKHIRSKIAKTTKI